MTLTKTKKTNLQGKTSLSERDKGMVVTSVEAEKDKNIF